MRRVRMIVNLSGGGPGDRDWRDYPAGAELDMEDWEAADLVRIGLAVPAGDVPVDRSRAAAPEPSPPPPEDTGVSPVAEVSEVAQASVTAAGAVTELAPPAPSDIKQAWIDYAIARGEDPGIAPNMTKADLMSKYGARL